MNKGAAMMKLIECKYCNRIPLVMDVGGYSPYYEIYCRCGAIISSDDRYKAIEMWNLMHRKVDTE